MKAAFYRKQGPARDVLEVGELPDPEPGSGEVRVRLATSGVNPSDVKTRAGGRRPMMFPLVVPQNDGAGIIDKVGAGVPSSRVGERVWLYNSQHQRAYGTAAGFIALPAALAVPLPAGTDFAAGACLGVPALTAHRAVTLFGDVKGLTVLVTGGAGSVGHYAIQFARAKGARVIATVSSEEKAAHAKAGGAHEAINYRTENVADRIKELTGGRGVDRVVEVDFAGNAPLYDTILGSEACVAVYGSNSFQTTLSFSTFIPRQPTIRFFLVYELKPEPLRAALTEIDAMMKAGKLIHTVTKRFPLADIAAAHEAVESGKIMGNVVVDIAKLD